MPSPRIAFATSAKYRDLTRGDLLAVEQLRQRGCQVEPVVWTETAPNAVAYDAMVLRSVWDYHLEVERFLGWVSSVAERAAIFNDAKTVLWNSDKRYLFDLQDAGLPIPGMVLLEPDSDADLKEVLRSQRFSKAVVKPTVSASAFETYLVDSGNAAKIQPRVNQLLQSRAMLVQQYVPEIEASGEWSLMFFGGGFSHAVRKLPQSGDFRVQAEFGGSHRMEEPGSSVLAVAQRVMDEFAAHTLYARIDIVETQFQPLIMEVELIDPELFFAAKPTAAARFAEAFLRMMNQNRATGISTF